MNSTALIILIIVSIILLIIIYRFIKPYIIKYNTTIFLCGELGSGKTLTAVKIAIIQIRKARTKIWIYNNITIKIKNHFIKKQNKKALKKGKEIKELIQKKRKPQLISNIPIHFKQHFYSHKKEWSVVLKKEMILLLMNIPEYSVVLIDELPQLVSQFDWSIDLVANNVNEFITFFRHYYNGHLILTAQSTSDVVVQIRRKCNQAIWCNNLKKHLFGLFYTINMCDMILDDNISTMSTTFISDNTHKNYGLFPPKNTYDSRCYSERTNNMLEYPKNWDRHTQIKTNKIIRMKKYISPLDDTTTKQFKENQKKECKEL